MSKLYKPGDTIIRTFVTTGREKVFTVGKPAYTRAGKLRLIAPNGNVRTTWWGSSPSDFWLPPNYRRGNFRP